MPPGGIGSRRLTKVRTELGMDKEDQYWKPVGASMPTLKPSARQTTTFPAQADLSRSTWINQCVQLVFGSYRKDDFADPDSFRVQLGMVLERYSDDIIRSVTSPITGIQRKCKFPPSIAEVVEFADECKRQSTYAKQWDARSRQQLEERERMQCSNDREPIEHRKKVAARILEEYQARK